MSLAAEVCNASSGAPWRYCIQCKFFAYLDPDRNLEGKMKEKLRILLKNTLLVSYTTRWRDTFKRQWIN